VTSQTVTVVGGGILGLWQALTLRRRGHLVRLVEAAPRSATGASSRYAGAMLAPYCEAEAAEPIVEKLGVVGLRLWREACPALVTRGSLVVAAARDQADLVRFARMTGGHETIDAARLATLEPDLAGRFGRALYFAQEAHVNPRAALEFLISELEERGATLRFGEKAAGMERAATEQSLVVDCRGLAARADLPSLRGVRGEMAVLRVAGLELTRPVRLLHPRFPLYIVPWGGGLYMVGATVIESEDPGPVSARSALELLAAAYALHPGFGEAAIVELGAALRPAFPDNVPRAIVHGRRVFVNGAYRHGFLLAPVLAEAVADSLESGRADHPLLTLAA
jgi:glycine oxidase